ncbi:DNA repair protein REV1-like [Dreissena polymorpha]|uniref:DNA repair protein REV1-like n=1 Tax=Dreissena polymorpha TaxID=45954 RepID=UPI00226514F4|nr:DNA repair protein REV1-like [Dreissena polymorpha]
MADTDDTSTSLPCRDDSETQYFETGLSPKEEFSENLKDFSGMETSLQHNGPAENFHAKAQSRSPAKAGDPKFLSEYYGNSRLHFLSTWKAEFKEYINAIQKKGDNFPGREKLRHVVQSREANASQSEHSHFTYVKKSHERCIMHIDMDCFFVSVGLLKRPDLIGKPVAVTHSLGKGATVDPRSDLGFERREWAKNVSNQKREKSGLNAKMDSLNEENMSFPDQSESDTDDDVTDDVTDVSNFSRTSESFHSMAELASCSYEARKAGG